MQRNQGLMRRIRFLWSPSPPLCEPYHLPCDTAKPPALTIWPDQWGSRKAPAMPRSLSLSPEAYVWCFGPMRSFFYWGGRVAQRAICWRGRGDPEISDDGHGRPTSLICCAISAEGKKSLATWVHMVGELRACDGFCPWGRDVSEMAQGWADRRDEGKWAGWGNRLKRKRFSLFLFLFSDFYFKSKSNSSLNSKLFTFRCTNKMPTWLQTYIYYICFILVLLYMVPIMK
jgi:hypothetical protein